MEGWIALYRRMVSWEWYDSPKTKVVFLDCLLYAAHQPRSWHGEKLERGQLITSVAKQAKRLGLTQKEVRGAWDRLVRTGEITKRGASSYTVITLCNFDTWQHQKQDEGQTKGEQGANEGQTKGDIQQLNNVNNGEEGGQQQPLGAKFFSAWSEFGMAKVFGDSMATQGKKERIESLHRFLSENGKTLEDYFEKCLAAQWLRRAEEPNRGKFGPDWFLNVENATKVLQGEFDEIYEPGATFRRGQMSPSEDDIAAKYGS